MKNIYTNKFSIESIMILTSLSVGVMSFFLPIYSKELDMSATEIGVLYSIISFIIIIIRPFIGKLTDNLGRKPILCSGILLSCISYIVFSVADNSLKLYLARVFQGLSVAFMGISIDAIVADTHKENNISEGFGKLDSATSTGNIYGCILAFIILYRFSFFKGWKVLFLIFALTSFHAFIKVIRNFTDENHKVFNKKLNIKNYSSNVKILLLIVFITSLFSSMMTPIFMVYLQDKITSNLNYLALAFFPAILISSRFSARIGSFSDRFGKIKSMIIGIIICGVSIIILPNLNSIFLFAVMWTICSVGGTFYDLSETGLYAELNEKNDNGKIFGVYSLVCNFASMIGTLLGGFLYDNVSLKAPFYFNGVGYIIAAIIIQLLLKKSIDTRS